MAEYKPHVTKAQEATVKTLVKLIDENPIVGVLNMESLPGKNLAGMRKSLRDKVDIVMAKKRLIKIAFKKSKKEEVAKLEEHLKGMPALLFTKDNPFTLFKTIKKNQSPAPIKAGQEAPKDLIVPTGPTSFAPGPIIGELGQMGIKAGIEDGKVVIKQDCTLVKEGEVADEAKAALLTKMGVEPMRIGLALVAVFEEGDVLTAKVLDIDEDKFLADLGAAAAAASNLAYNIEYYTSDNVASFIQKAHVEADTLAYETDFVTKDNAERLLSKAHLQAAGLNELVPDAPVEKEEAPAEAEPAKEEAPAETTEEAPAEPPEEETPAEQQGESTEKKQEEKSE